MKFRMTMKDPDALYDAVAEAVLEEVKSLPLTAKERTAIAKLRDEQIRKAIAQQWMEYGEYIEIEFDTDAGTATVVPRKDGEG